MEKKSKQNVLIIGSGWGASSFIKHINNNKNYNINVISPSNTFVYTPLLVNSLFNTNIQLKIPLKYINPHINYINNIVSQVDFKNNEIITNSNEKINYDYLILI